MALRTFRIMETHIRTIQALMERDFDHFLVNRVALNFVLHLDEYLACLVTVMDQGKFPIVLVKPS